MFPSPLGKVISVFVLGTFLTACSPQQHPALETEIPTQPASASPTVITTSIAEINNSAGFIENIRIETPGLGSRITSPILLKVLVPQFATGFIRIEVTSQTGSLLARQILSIDQGGITEIRVPIYFEINRATSEAQLIASLEDEYGRLKTLDSVALTLLQEGTNDLQSNQIENQIEIGSPKADDTIPRGSVTIAGQAASQPGRALNIELITRAGRVLAFGEAYPEFEDGNESGTFSLTLDYEVDEPTWVLIGVAERLTGFIIHYASVEVLLLP